MKCVWIINQYASTPDLGFGGRSYYLARELVKCGVKVYLVASSASHLLQGKVVFDGEVKFENVDGVNFVWVKMPEYSGAHSKRRIVNWFLFSSRIKRLWGQVTDRPDAIICSSPSLISFLGAKSLSRKLGAKLIFEVRDIWPLTLQEIGGYSAWHPFIRFLQWLECKAYRDSDIVVSNLKNALEHMQSRGLAKEKFVWIPNGFSLDEVNQCIALNDKTASALPKDKFIIGYAGTLGLANSLDTLIESAETLKDHDNLAFVLVGAGKEKNRLISLTQEKGLKNVYFIDPVPKVEIQSLLSNFDVCFIGAHKSPMYRFGVSPNKLYDYLYSGKPTIYAIESGSYRPVEQSGAGIQVEAQNPAALAEGILKIYQCPETERAQMGVQGRKVALEQYEYSALARKLYDVVW